VIPDIAWMIKDRRDGMLLWFTISGNRANAWHEYFNSYSKRDDETDKQWRARVRRQYKAVKVEIRETEK